MEFKEWIQEQYKYEAMCFSEVFVKNLPPEISVSLNDEIVADGFDLSVVNI